MFVRRFKVQCISNETIITINHIINRMRDTINVFAFYFSNYLGGEPLIKIHLSRILGERRITQRRLAEMADVRPNSVNAIYNEKAQRIDLDVLYKLCKALDCQPGDLMERVDDY